MITENDQILVLSIQPVKERGFSLHRNHESKADSLFHIHHVWILTDILLGCSTTHLEKRRKLFQLQSHWDMKYEIWNNYTSPMSHRNEPAPSTFRNKNECVKEMSEGNVMSLPQHTSALLQAQRCVNTSVMSHSRHRVIKQWWTINQISNNSNALCCFLAQTSFYSQFGQHSVSHSGGNCARFLL